MLAEMEEELRCAFLTLPGHWHVHTALRAGDDHLVQSHSEILYLTVGVQVPIHLNKALLQSSLCILWHMPNYCAASKLYLPAYSIM